MIGLPLILQKLEGTAPTLIQGTNLPVENTVFYGELGHGLHHFREAVIERLLISGPELDFLSVLNRQDAKTIKLHFVKPKAVVWRCRRHCSLHRLRQI